MEHTITFNDAQAIGYHPNMVDLLILDGAVSTTIQRHIDSGVSPFMIREALLRSESVLFDSRVSGAISQVKASGGNILQIFLTIFETILSSLTSGGTLNITAIIQAILALLIPTPTPTPPTPAK